MIGYSLPSQPVQGGLGARHVGLDGLRDRRAGQAEQRRLGPVHPDFELGPAVVASEAGVSHLRRRVHDVLGRLRNSPRVD